MRKLFSSWSNTFHRVGLKVTPKTRRQATRRCIIENLEPRWLFSTSQAPTPFLVGDCTDDCPCDCSEVSTASDDSAITKAQIGELNLSYNSSTQPHPVLTFNLRVTASPPDS